MKTHGILGLSASLMLAALVGCNGSTAPVSNDGGTTDPAHADGGHGAHAHPTVGPHKGDLVELGNEEYHAEIVHGEGGLVSVYVLDSHATVAVPIDATEVTINITHDGMAEQFKLPAVPETSDPMGKSSRFQLQDADLAGDLDHEGVAAKLVLNINGKQYTGKIEHKHAKGAGAAHEHGHTNTHSTIEKEAVGGTPFEQELYLTPGGIYTSADIAANGNTVPSVKFKGIHWAHDDAVVGDKICPVTSNKSDAKCNWIVNEKTYDFCCNPCIDKFVKWAKTSPEKIKDPETYVLKEGV